MLLVIGRLIKVTPASSTAVRQINYVINGKDASSNASVNEVENMQYRWKQGITLPREGFLRVKGGIVLFICVCCIGHAKTLRIAFYKVNKIRLLLFL
jgi:hypothetical protein